MEDKSGMSATAQHIPASWTNWIAENRALGVPAAEIDAILTANGFDISNHHTWPKSRQAAKEIGTPEITWKINRMEALLRIYSRLWREVRGAATLDRISDLHGESFFRWYYAPNRPVVLVDGMKDCPAFYRWSPAYLKKRFGTEVVEVMTERSHDQHYELNCERHKTRMPLSRFVDQVQSAAETNDFYMVANNRSLENTSLGSLLDEIQIFDEILDNSDRRSKVFLWFGPAGTVTPLHQDAMNVLLTQVVGSKLITLIPSFELPLIYNHVGVYSEVDLESPDYSRYPLFQETSRIQVVLEPGQALFIPVGWWHHVRSLEASISVSFTNFLAPNNYATEYAE
jgi:ribosomal protein L16 Arg81 hydroxylase